MEACNDILNTPLLSLKWQNHKQSSLLLCTHYKANMQHLQTILALQCKCSNEIIQVASNKDRELWKKENGDNQGSTGISAKSRSRSILFYLPGSRSRSKS